MRGPLACLLPRSAGAGALCRPGHEALRLPTGHDPPLPRGLPGHVNVKKCSQTGGKQVKNWWKRAETAPVETLSCHLAALSDRRLAWEADREAWKGRIARNQRGMRHVGLNVTQVEETSGRWAVTLETAAEPEKSTETPQAADVGPSSAGFRWILVDFWWFSAVLGRFRAVLEVLLTRERSIYVQEKGRWWYQEASELQREVVQGAGSLRQLSS